jgi:hypothetical protein
VRESRPPGSVRGVPSNGHPYRDVRRDTAQSLNIRAYTGGYSLKALFSTWVVSSETTPLVIRSLKTDRGELPVAGEQPVDELHVIERRYGAHFCANLLAKNFRSFSRSPPPCFRIRYGIRPRRSFRRQDVCGRCVQLQ